MNPIIYLLIIVAIGVAISAEVLIAYQKYQMKKEFNDELDSIEQQHNMETDDTEENDKRDL